MSLIQYEFKHKYWIIIAMVALLAGCTTVTEKQYKLAQQSIRQGDYAQAFDQAARSLTARISNFKTIRLFPDISEHAYADKLAEIERYKTSKNWDRVAYGYDRIIAMNQTIRQLQQALSAYAEKARMSQNNQLAVQRMLDLNTRDVSAEHTDYHQRAAAGHYVRGKQLLASKAYRQANSEFSTTLSFMNPYKDAASLALESGHLADLADAKQYYNQAKQAVQQHRHRDAAIAFAKADGFIPNYRDARQLAGKYKQIADQEDALAYYQKGDALAQSHQYRAAAQAFNQSLSFVPGFRDAYEQARHYTDLANREDAGRYYARAMDLMDEQAFGRAAQAFEQADRIVPGFRDAEAMANQARSFIPPNDYELKELVQESVKKGIPLTWLDDIHQGYTEDVVITGLRIVRRGYFNARHEFWPYRLRVSGTYKLEIPNANEQVLSFDTVVDYRIFRDDFGDWKASFR